jgi:uncharacterized protein RhaS with RHS repeats
MYSPELGFLQTDPIGYAGGKNLYAAVGGDPSEFNFVTMAEFSTSISVQECR